MYPHAIAVMRWSCRGLPAPPNGILVLLVEKAVAIRIPGIPLWKPALLTFAFAGFVGAWLVWTLGRDSSTTWRRFRCRGSGSARYMSALPLLIAGDINRSRYATRSLSSRFLGFHYGYIPGSRGSSTKDSRSRLLR